MFELWLWGFSRVDWVVSFWWYIYNNGIWRGLGIIMMGSYVFGFSYCFIVVEGIWNRIKVMKRSDIVRLRLFGRVLMLCVKFWVCVLLIFFLLRLLNRYSSDRRGSRYKFIFWLICCVFFLFLRFDIFEFCILMLLLWSVVVCGELGSNGESIFWFLKEFWLCLRWYLLLGCFRLCFIG